MKNRIVGGHVHSAKIVGERRYSIISDYLGTPVEAYTRRVSVSPTDEWSDFVTKGRAGTLPHDFDAISGPMLANPRGKSPKAKGSQFAIFTDKTADLFDKHKVAVIDRH